MPHSATTRSTRPPRHPASLVALFALIIACTLWNCATDPPTGPTITIDVGDVIDFLSEIKKDRDDTAEKPDSGTPDKEPDSGIPDTEPEKPANQWPGAGPTEPTEERPGTQPEPPEEPAEEDPVAGKRSFTHYSSSQATTLLMPEYEVVVSYGAPFGISSLKMKDQQLDFVNRARLSFGTQGIIADWEWFKIQVNGREEWLKLKAPYWPSPEIDLSDEQAALRFTRANAILDGIDLEVEFVFAADRPAFDVTYTIRNGTDQVLVEPYTMLGFPGFPNYNRVIEVATAERSRRPRPPHRYYRQEADAVGGEKLLLLHDVLPLTGDIEELYASVVMQEGSRFFTLETAFTPTFDYTRVYSAHTNKPGYLTSHLYSFYDSILPGSERSATLRYVMTASGQ